MINLEKEIRQQPSVLASLLEKNKTTLEALASELKTKNINNIYFAEYELSKGFQLHSEMIPDWFNKFVLS